MDVAPNALEKLDLEKALPQMITEIKSAASVEIDYQCSTALNCFNEDEEDVIYRIVQKSITNSVRHVTSDGCAFFIVVRT